MCWHFWSPLLGSWNSSVKKRALHCYGSITMPKPVYEQPASRLPDFFRIDFIGAKKFVWLFLLSLGIKCNCLNLWRGLRRPWSTCVCFRTISKFPLMSKFQCSITFFTPRLYKYIRIPYYYRSAGYRGDFRGGGAAPLATLWEFQEVAAQPTDHFKLVRPPEPRTLQGTKLAYER